MATLQRLAQKPNSMRGTMPHIWEVVHYRRCGTAHIAINFFPGVTRVIVSIRWIEKIRNIEVWILR